MCGSNGICFSFRHSRGPAQHQHRTGGSHLPVGKEAPKSRLRLRADTQALCAPVTGRCQLHMAELEARPWEGRAAGASSPGVS